MSWTAPRTWVTGEIPTGSMMNTHLRDDLTALQAQSAVVATSQTSASTSYTDLATTGPALTLVTGTQVLLTVGAQMGNTGALISMSAAVSGASTIAAGDAWMVAFASSGALVFAQDSYQSLFTGLTAGTNTFTAKYKTSAGTATWSNRNMVVEACY